MATLILTAAGSAVGGPLGGAIGALIGQRVDRAVLGSKREGPRLAELKVQTSSYGTEIPKLFGTMRVAGTVIWATDLQETRSTSGGKGQPKQTNYAYAANFAVALSARRVTRVGRIWADGNLMRGAAGDWKVRTGFRLHPGTEDQAVDPLIASAEGALAPAHRGIAYAVFEGLELADYGNRIPSLTFEVVADEGEVASGAVALALAGEVAAAGTNEDGGLMLGGFAASGGSVRGMLDTLAAASGGWFAPVGGGLALRTGGAAARTVADLGAGGPREVRAVAGAGTVPGLVSVSHYDAARDYQAGLQRTRLPGGVSPREERVEVPAVLAAGQAKAVAERVLARREAERVRRTVAAGLDALDVAPGEVVAIAGEPGAWRVVRATLEGMAVTLELLPVVGAQAGVAASGGRVLGQADAPAGTTRLVAFETPALDDAVLAAPRLSVAAAGTGAGWRRAALLLSVDAGGSWDEAGDTAGAAVIGTVVMPPPAGSAALIDLRGTVEVELLHAGMVLEPADDQRLDRGANLALVGDELLQFGTAELIAGTRWRLGRLLRGRRGTEWAAGAQGAGDRFVLIEAGRVRDVALPTGTGHARVLASGVGDPVPAEAAVTLDGASVRPPGVARLRWDAAGEGEASVRWVRRSRAGWRWSDGADVPLGEETERYLVTITRPDGSVTAAEVTVPSATVPRPCTVTVRQIGTNGTSRSVTVVVPG